MIGWIKLHRKLLEWEWYDDANASRLFIHCLLKANYEPKVWHGINIERGQFFTSTHTLANELKLTDKQIRVAMQKLSKCENLAIKRANNGTMITICNYDSYQDKEETEGQTIGQLEGEPRANEGQQHKNTKKGKEIKEYNLDFVVDEFLEIFNKWLKYKKERKEVYKSETSIKTCYEKLIKFSNNNKDIANEIINDAIGNNYAGFFAPKEIKPHQTPNINKFNDCSFPR